MSRNGRIACLTFVVVLMCAAVFCLSLGLLGAQSFIRLAPTFSINLPFRSFEAGSSTSTPVVIRPAQPGDSQSSATPLSSPLPQASQVSPVPKSSFTPSSVPTNTLYTLGDTFIPINDPIDLAKRLLGINGLSPTVASTPPKKVGDRQSFWVGNGEQDNFQVPATLEYVTDHAYFWVEEGIRYRQRDLQSLANAFENQIYPTDRSYFGSEWTPGVDGDPHIYILYARGIGEENAGYFSSADEYPVQINRYSNEHEMFLVNADNSPLDDEYTFGVLAHEFQHMIQWYQDRNESSWISEGFSELAVLVNHYYSGGFDALYTSQPDMQLNNWPGDAEEDTTPHYGASFLFLTYFLDRFGEAATKALVSNQDNDLNGVDKTLQEINATDPLTGKPVTADSFFLDWAVTNYLMDRTVADGRYSYSGYNGAPHAEPTENIYSCPIGDLTRDVHQYGVDYIRVNCPGSYTLHFEGSIQTPLLPQDPHTGRYAFWSNKSDESDTTLTKSFDLTNQSGPLTLSYWTWYDIEKGWDYVYLEASTDGVHWQVLVTPSGSSSNPQGNSYGWGYTGASGNPTAPTWIHESVDLTQFAGHNLTLRFEYVTDSNVTGEGFLLDDVSIPEIGYSTSFESDDGGWHPAGWARIENILPQTFALALISVGKTTTVQDITLGTNVSADIPFSIGEDVDHVVLVVAGSTRYTRQLAPYRFNINRP